MADPFTDGEGELQRAEHISPRKTGDNISAKRVATYVWNSSTLEWERMTQPGGSSSSSGTPLDTYTYIQKDTTDTVYKYYGYADGNTAGAWAIKRITISTNLAEYVKGTTGYTAAWTARDDGSTHTYADLWTTF